MANTSSTVDSGGRAQCVNYVTQVTTPDLNGMSIEDCMAFLEYQTDAINTQFRQVLNQANDCAAAGQVLNELSAKLSKYSDMDSRIDKQDGAPDGTANNAKNQNDCRDAVLMIETAEAKLPPGSPALAKLESLKKFFSDKAANPDCIVGASEMASKLAEVKSWSDAAGQNQNMQMTEVQVLTGRLARVNEMVSNILHKIDEAMSAAVNNMK